MVKGFYKTLLNLIFIVLLLLCLCAGVDYAAVDNETITANSTEMNTSNCTLIKGVHYDNQIVDNKTIGVAKFHKVVVEKTKLPLIKITAKPSCGCRNSYRWHTRTFVNYCPHCHRYGALYNKHKWAARHEQELTCKYDDCDYCGVCGKEKYSWSKYYLRRA